MFLIHYDLPTSRICLRSRSGVACHRCHCCAFLGYRLARAARRYVCVHVCAPCMAACRHTSCNSTPTLQHHSSRISNVIFHAAAALCATHRRQRRSAGLCASPHHNHINPLKTYLCSKKLDNLHCFPHHQCVKTTEPRGFKLCVGYIATHGPASRYPTTGNSQEEEWGVARGTDVIHQSGNAHSSSN